MLAHHDDEIPCAGVLGLMGERARVCWLTNSDGLYFESDLEPAAYGELRKKEGIESVKLAGVAPERTRCLDFSEVEIYRHLAALHSGKMTIGQAGDLFDAMFESVEQAVEWAEPDAVFMQAWQGGHPEHDLSHFLCRLAVERWVEKGNPPPAMFHMPAYEYTVLLAFRFNPLYRGQRIRMKLLPAELDRKLRMISCYPSQQRLFEKFRKVLGALSIPSAMLGRPRTLEQWLSVEEFGPVPEGIDYTASTHFHEFFDYMFEDFEGTPVSFSGSVRPVVLHLLRSYSSRKLKNTAESQ